MVCFFWPECRSSTDDRSPPLSLSFLTLVCLDLLAKPVTYSGGLSKVPVEKVPIADTVPVE